jgi:hypothetical protein
MAQADESALDLVVVSTVTRLQVKPAPKKSMKTPFLKPSNIA